MVFKNRSKAGVQLTRELVEFHKDTKAVILVDDGIATGATMKVSIRAARSAGAAQVVVAIPVAAPSSVRELEAEEDQVVCLDTPEYFYAVGQAYQSFDQVSDEEVCNILDSNA